MPFYPELKVVGWTSGYKSIQKFMDEMRKDKMDEEHIFAGLDAIAKMCIIVGQNPDEIIASLKSHRVDSNYYVKIGKDALKKLGWPEDSLYFFEITFALFKLCN